MQIKVHPFDANPVPLPPQPSTVIMLARSHVVHLRLLGELGVGVGDLDTELLGACDDFYPLPRGDGVCDPASNEYSPSTLPSHLYLLGSVGLVVHEEEVHVADVVDEEGLVAGRHHVAGLLVAAVSDLYHISHQHSPLH